MRFGRKLFIAHVSLLIFMAVLGHRSAVLAQSIDSALASAYFANPSLNAQRALTRATDESVPQARAGQRPNVTATGNVGLSEIESRGAAGTTDEATFVPRGVGLSINQNLFDGFRTPNSIRRAESQVLGARETLRNTEQNVLLDGATAYMNVLRDTAILELNKNNEGVLAEQLRQTRDRFAVGEVTRTDVAQAEASLAAARANVAASDATLRTSIGNFRQVIGVDPKRLTPVKPIAKLLPRNREQAFAISEKEHPAIIAARHGVDAQLLQVKIAEGFLYPTLALTGSLASNFDNNGPNVESRSASVVLGLSVPIYQGGAEYSTVRAAKETLSQTQFQVDVARLQVRAALTAAWAQFEATEAQIRAAQEQVAASEIALNGVREEAKVGQRTTLDVLNAQQAVLNARVTLVSAQRDRVVASYNLAAATGRLSARSLGLKVTTYDPKVHYEQVKDKWIGLRTPDGR